MSDVLRAIRRNLSPIKTGFEPRLPSPAKEPPRGPGWLHQIKHDGYQMMVRRDGAGIRVLTRNGYGWSSPAIRSSPQPPTLSRPSPL
jgi:ATP-dependent DNA ligase